MASVWAAGDPHVGGLGKPAEERGFGGKRCFQTIISRVSVSQPGGKKYQEKDSRKERAQIAWENALNSGEKIESLLTALAQVPSSSNYSLSELERQGSHSYCRDRFQCPGRKGAHQKYQTTVPARKMTDRQKLFDE